MEQKQKRYFDMKIVIGLLVIAAGVVLLLKSLGAEVNVRIWDYWPVIIILIGLGKLLQPKEYRSIYWGLILTVVGTLFLLNNLGYVHFWFNELWPLLLILVGVEILRGSIFRHRIKMKLHLDGSKESGRAGCCPPFADSRTVDSDYIDISAILGGVEYNFSNKKLKGGNASVIMGGCDIDLREAEMEGDCIILHASALMGGIEVRVPSHWQVVMQGTPILGAMENKTSTPGKPVKKIIIKGTAVMGAVEVKN